MIPEPAVLRSNVEAVCAMSKTKMRKQNTSCRHGRCKKWTKAVQGQVNYRGAPYEKDIIM